MSDISPARRLNMRSNRAPGQVHRVEQVVAQLVARVLLLARLAVAEARRGLAQAVGEEDGQRAVEARGEAEVVGELVAHHGIGEAQHRRLGEDLDGNGGGCRVHE
jgi:hypothetical protein